MNNQKIVEKGVVERRFEIVLAIDAVMVIIRLLIDAATNVQVIMFNNL